MIDLLINEYEKSTSEGYESLYITGEMTWTLKGFKSSDKLIDYEDMVNDRFFKKYPVKALCQYNWKSFPSDIIEGIIKSHPYILWNGEIIKNIFYFQVKDKPEEKRKNWLQHLIFEIITQAGLKKDFRK